jgi:L,D-transpeptidase catalytic domain
VRPRSLVIATLALVAGMFAVTAAPGLARGVAGRLTLTPSNVNGSVGAVISGTTWHVDGTMTRYKRGQRVVVHAFDNGRLFLSRTLGVTRSGSTGIFHTSIHVAGVGRVTVRAIHLASARAPFMVSKNVGVWVVAPSAFPGERSFSVRILQAQLSALHYVVGEPGVLDDRTQRAVLAFRKMVNLPRTMVADATVFDALATGEGAFPVEFPSHGRHVEGDLTHQVLALIGADGQVQSLYPLSSGKPSTPTTLGSFHVYERTPGVNNVGMVDSSYFNGGDAIHGYPEVPPFAASHGCLRVPIPDALTIYDWVALGTPVDVYYR